MNVVRDASGNDYIEWTHVDDSTWCTVEYLVKAHEAGGGVPDWFEEGWITCDNEIAEGFVAIGSDELPYGIGLTLEECKRDAMHWNDGTLEGLEFEQATAAALNEVRVYDGLDAKIIPADCSGPTLYRSYRYDDE